MHSLLGRQWDMHDEGRATSEKAAQPSESQVEGVPYVKALEHWIEGFFISDAEALLEGFAVAVCR